MIPSVSVIIPAYNVEEFLSDAIQSILSQTFQEWELIIVDDCSTDHTFQIAKEFAARDSRIKVIRTEKQSGGPFIPRKKAMEVATSDLISPFDADDRIENDYLESLIARFNQNDVDAVFPVLHKWDGKDGYSYPNVNGQLMNRKISGREALCSTLDGWQVHCGGGIIKKSLYKKGYAELEGEDVIPFIDEMLTRVLLHHADSVYFTYIPYFYRDNPSSVTHSKAIKKLGFAVNPRIIGFVKRYYDIQSKEYMLAHRQNFHGIFDAMRIINKPDSPDDSYKEDSEIIEK